ncbi:hypothetical protein [Chromohalobacter sp. HP20-39]|uniref:hypothetical protein n=1 Tax=Chromohalobacter sp. HP20-39 TaxID=3079306 RepID=UPI00294B3BD7|nr:hypothetical protein [Chromohalobacter sp. HP20-39]MDV6319138.1 hypothetical protein [Chromohalobacter sp. HP20-39]
MDDSSSKNDAPLSVTLRNATHLLFITASMGILTACHMLFFGISDMTALFLFIITSYLIFRSVLDLRMGSRKALRVYLKKESFFTAYLSQDKPWGQIALSIITAAFLSLAFIVVLKGMSLSYGFWSMLIIVGIAALFVRAINIGTIKETVGNNATDSVSHHAISMISTIVTAFWLNLLLSMILSAHDLFTFLSSEIDFSSFVTYAETRSIDETIDNEVSRFFVNLYVIINSFKVAMANEITTALDVSYQEKSQYFYVFYFSTLVMNMVKLFGFSLTLVFIQKTVEERIAPFVRDTWGKACPFLHKRFYSVKKR